MKYLHVICHESPKLNGFTINMINNKISLKDDTVFITYNDRYVDNDCENLLYTKDLIGYINKHYKYFDYIFIHAMNFSAKQLLRIKRKAIKKFIWCIWGHDLYLPQNLFKNKIIYYIKRHILKNINAVCMAFYMDLFEVRKFIGYNCRAFFMPYGLEENVFGKYKDFYKKKKKSNTINIMIGHSGYAFLNHIKILNILKKYENENIKIFLPLTYGVSEYINDVKNFVYSNYAKDKVIIIEKQMTLDDYMEFLTNIDIAIFDHIHQSALGNIFNLSFLGKKIYFNKDSIIKQGFDLLGLKTEIVENIENMSFDKFIEEFSEKDIEKLHHYGDLYINDYNIIEAWKKVFDILSN